MAPLLLLAAWISGAAALAAETLWFRGLGRGVGTSAEALATVSASFLGGLGVGSAIAARRSARSASPLRAAAVCEGIAGILVALSPWFVAIVPAAHLALLHAFSLEPGPSAWPAALVVLPVLGLPAAFLGATLPFLVRGRLTRLSSAGRWTGLLYATNTVGAACGTLAAAFLLLPTYGESASLHIAGAGNLVAALLLLAADGIAAGPTKVVEPERSGHGGLGRGGVGSGRVGTGDTATLVEHLEIAPRVAGDAAVESGGADGHLVARVEVVGPWVDRRITSTTSLALFASGFLALGGEVAWFRLLEPITGVHLYGLAVLLVAVLLGTALGAAIGGFAADRTRRPDLALAVVLAFAGVLTALSIVVAGATPSLAIIHASDAAEAARAAATANAAGAAAAAGASALFVGRIAGAFLTVVPPLVAFAAAYPLAVRARARSVAGAASAAGSVYAWNTAGNVAGSLVAGFFLLPRLGSPATLLLLGGLGVAIGAATWLVAHPPRSALAALLLLLPLAPACRPGTVGAAEAAAPSLPEVVAIARWGETYRVRSRDDVRVLAEMAVGTYPHRRGEPDGPLIQPIEGVMSTVGLLVERGDVRLRHGGLSESKILARDPDAGTETEVSLALIPYLACAAPKHACVIGHGAGYTPETAIATGMEVDVAEIESAVLDEVERYRGPLEVRRAGNAHLRIADGRLLLRDAASRPTGRRYDVVVSQPSHPWVPGAGHLFTRDFYRLAKSSLNDGGVFAQWLNMFSMSTPLFRTALQSWREVFPACWVFVYASEVILVGFADASESAPGATDGVRKPRTPPIEIASWGRALATNPVGERARAAGIHVPEDLLRHLTLDGEGVAKVLGDPAPAASTDDDPRLETGLAWLSFRAEDHSNDSDIEALLSSGFPPDFQALFPDPVVRERALEDIALRSVSAGVSKESRRWISPAIPMEGGVTGRRARARHRLAEAKSKDDDTERARLRGEAARLLNEALERTSDDADLAREWLAAATDAGDDPRVAERGAALVAKFPDHGGLLAEWARALMSSNDEEKAADAFKRAVAARHPQAPAGTAFRYARLLLSQHPPALVEARDVLRADPQVASDVDALEELERLEIETSSGAGGQAVAGASPEQREASRRLREARAAAGYARLDVARRSVVAGDHEGLEAARDATRALPESAEAWRLLAWYELRAKSGDDAVRTALSHAIEHAKDVTHERFLARGLLRLFRREGLTLEGGAR